MLILTEKPSVAKAFAEALNVPRKGSCYENTEYCITNALGHLLESYAPEDYHPDLKKFTLEKLPIIPEKVRFKPIEKTKEQLKIVKACFDKHKNKPLLMATDAEREGELIGAEILDYVGFKNYDMAKRFWVSEALTPEVIKKGIANAKYLTNYAEYKKQGYARQQADWLVGINLTRLITLKSKKLLHFGRVQTALLTAIYQREQSIKNFIPETYYEVKAVLQGTNPFSVKLINPDNEEFPTRFSMSSKILAETLSIKDTMKSGIITELKKEKKSIQPPQLYNLTALQKAAHKKYSYSPEQTLEIAQSLYEKHKCLSYPRTPSRVMGDDNVSLFKSIYDKLISAYTGFPLESVMSGVREELISETNKRIFNTKELQDHHALVPLAPLPNSCSQEEENIYSLVFSSFFTVIKPNYIYNSVFINVDISGHLFQGYGTEILQPGWKTNTANTEDEDDEQQENYSSLEKNKEYPVKSISPEEKQTEPKKRYTFSTLLQLMENPRNEEGKRLTGLGTPATRGAILQKLVDRRYIILKGKSVLISSDGSFLIENVLKNKELANFVSLPETTKWEEQLHIDTGKFLEGIKDFICRAVNSTEMAEYKIEKSILGKCPLCNNGDIFEGKNNFYCSNYKLDNACKFTIGKEICGSKITETDIKILLTGKKTKVKKFKSPKTGKDFSASLSLRDGKIEFKFVDSKK